jgi:hypothetical protein
LIKILKDGDAWFPQDVHPKIFKPPLPTSPAQAENVDPEQVKAEKLAERHRLPKDKFKSLLGLPYEHLLLVLQVVSSDFFIETTLQERKKKTGVDIEQINLTEYSDAIVEFEKSYRKRHCYR